MRRQADGYFLDATGAPVATWPGKFNLGTFIVQQGNEVIVAQPDLLPADRCGNIVLAVFLHCECACSSVTGDSQPNRYIVHHQHGRRHRAIRTHCNLDLGAAYRTHIATGIVNLRFAVRPGRVPIGQHETFNTGHINHLDTVCLTAYGGCRHIIV